MENAEKRIYISPVLLGLNPGDDGDEGSGNAPVPTDRDPFDPEGND